MATREEIREGIINADCVNFCKFFLMDLDLYAGEAGKVVCLAGEDLSICREKQDCEKYERSDHIITISHWPEYSKG